MTLPRNDKQYHQYDILNDKKNDWLNCVTGEKRNDSFFELMEKASNDLKVLDEIFESINNGAYDISQINRFVNNINHSGFEVNAKKIYYKLYSEE